MTDHRRLARALRETADRLEAGARYEWGHMGRCNCGHLVQTVTGMSDREIVASADNQLDEWSEHARALCTDTGTPAEAIFDALLELGLTHHDVIHLEHLSDRRVLKRVDRNAKPLRKNRADHVALYMKAMSDMLAPPSIPSSRRRGKTPTVNRKPDHKSQIINQKSPLLLPSIRSSLRKGQTLTVNRKPDHKSEIINQKSSRLLPFIPSSRKRGKTLTVNRKPDQKSSISNQKSLRLLPCIRSSRRRGQTPSANRKSDQKLEISNQKSTD